MIKYFLILILLPVCSYAEGKFITGLGYIKPAEYRVDNEINPLPLGLSVVPMIAYRGERLNIMGPNISYALVKGAIGLSTGISVNGDRYKSQDLEQRDTAVNMGISLRLIALTLSHASDISHVHNGNVSKATIGWRFKLGETLSLSPNMTKEFLNPGYVNYYYGINKGESNFYSAYEARAAVNDIYGMSFGIRISEGSSIAINYSYKSLDKVIGSSPTVAEDSFDTWSVFWSYML